MILTLIGLSLNFIGTLAIIIETISGGSIRYKIYSNSLQKVYEIGMDHNIKRIKPNFKEIRILVWFILICIGFFIQLLDLLIPNIRVPLN